MLYGLRHSAVLKVTILGDALEKKIKPTIFVTVTNLALPGNKDLTTNTIQRCWLACEGIMLYLVLGMVSLFGHLFQ